MSTNQAVPCPMMQAHKRLMDCHAQWHALQEAYSDPDDFRLALNAFLQTHRSVTSLLLKHKSNLPEFHNWFTAYSENDAKTEVMRWAKNSRNRIVHDSDLDLNSSCHVTWIGDWYARSEVKAKFPPRMSPNEIFAAIRASRGIPPFGTITIRRRWVDKALASWEVLDAAAACYMYLSNLLRAGHEAANVDVCDIAGRDIDCVDASLPNLPGSLRCMYTGQSELASYFSVADGTILTEATEALAGVEDLEAQAAAASEAANLPTSPDGDAVERVPGLMEIARKIMERDGAHGTFVFLFKGEHLLSIDSLQFDDQNAKRLSFERLAQRVESMRADGVLVIGEMWMGVQTETERKLGKVLMPARDRLDRTEGLSVYAVTRDGRQVERICTVDRGPNGEASCGDVEEFEVGAMNTMIPVFRKWKEMEGRGI